MQKFKIIIYYYLPIIFVTGLIFRSSSQTYSEQSLKPYLEKYVSNQAFWERIFSSVRFTYSGQVISVEEKGLYNFMEFFIRKGAHFTIYFILAILIMRLLRLYLRNQFVVFILSISLTFLYAVSDEFHQSFTVERTPLFADVVLDTFGGLIGLILFSLYLRFIANKAK